ncbi:MAG TPA: hypothetical protein VF792_04425 [Ktedonobacterales bacterium]
MERERAGHLLDWPAVERYSHRPGHRHVANHHCHHVARWDRSVGLSEGLKAELIVDSSADQGIAPIVG